MIIGIGINVVATERVKRALADEGGGFVRQVFTAGERAVCTGRADRALALAARFAAKDACLKALGAGWGNGYGLQQVEVITNEAGARRLSSPAGRRSGRASSACAPST